MNSEVYPVAARARSDDEQRAFAAIYSVVAQIPASKVSTYGRIAEMAGYRGAARTVGWAMHDAPAGLPCHRVVNATGHIAPGWPEQRTELEHEGVTFKPNGCVDLGKHLW